MTQCPDEIKQLIEHFDRQAELVRSPDYNETQLRIDFINPMFRCLGWDMDNSQRFAEQYREVVHEDRVKVAGQTKAPDYSFRIGGARKFFLEAKKPFVNIKMDWEPAYQLRRYGWSAKLALSILSDFEEFAVYDCRIAPQHLDAASRARREYFSYREYESRWDYLEGTFSKRAVLQGDFDKYCQTTRGRGKDEFDEKFLEEIEEWRKELAGNLCSRNPGLDEAGLNFSVQRIIDRIIFLRMAEDRGTEGAGQLQALLNGTAVYGRLRELFGDADKRYNSGLFHFEIERGREEAPDTLTPSLNIDDGTLKGIVKRLYYPESPYEFTVVSADILGSVYERFLGKVITLTPGHRARIEEKPEVRKAGGVYYTPTYIVDYIVKNTVGKLVEGKSVKEAGRVKVLDPACGSGSFLIGAYQYLLDWHLEQYVAKDPAKLAMGKSAVLRPGASGDWRLTIAERKRILLEHIHGVDLDGAAVEVTKLNLLLKCLEGETSATLGLQGRLFRERALPDLGHNILCGNSLIGTDIMDSEAWAKMSEEEKRRVNPFDYERGFAGVFKQGGFDAVIGNPPYVFTRGAGISEADKNYFYNRFRHQSPQLNTFGIFLERSLTLASDHGKVGFITPNNWLTIDAFQPLRRHLLDSASWMQIINITDRVFEAADVDTAILILQKGTSNSIVLGEMTGGKIAFESRVARSEFREPDLVFRIGLARSQGARKIIDTIERTSKPLATYATVSTGLKAYQTGKGHPPQTDKAKEIRKFHSPAKRNSTYQKYLAGSDVLRYRVSWSGEYLSYGEWLAEPRRSVPFNGPRILVRQIPGKPPYLVHATWTAQRCLNDINSMIVFDPTTSVSLKSLLALVDSKLISYWFKNSFDKLQRNIFPQFKVKELASFPIAAAINEPANAQLLMELVDKIMSLWKRATHERHPQLAEQIQREIEATDRRIDRLVYDLYGLTKEEIAIVEGNAE